MAEWWNGRHEGLQEDYSMLEKIGTAPIPSLHYSII